MDGGASLQLGVGLWCRAVHAAANTAHEVPSELRDAHREILELTGDVPPGTPIGVVAPTSALLAGADYFGSSSGTSDWLLPSPLVQARCVDPAFQAAAQGRHRGATDKIHRAVLELKREGSHVVHAFCLDPDAEVPCAPPWH